MSPATALLLDDPELELLDSDERPLESTWHEKQGHLFRAALLEGMQERGHDDFFVGVNLLVYYTPEQARKVVEEIRRERQMPLPYLYPEQSFPELAGGVVALDPDRHKPKKETFRGPDLFVVMDDVGHHSRPYWVTWEENGRLPDLVLELMSKSTAEVDLSEKKEIYAHDFGTREYFVYGPDREELGEHRDQLLGFRLGKDGDYEPIEPDGDGFLESEVLGLRIGRWHGEYLKEDGTWLRLYDPRGRLIPTGEEAAAQRAEDERQRAEAAERRADAERQRAETAEQRAEAAEAELTRLRKQLRS